MTPFVGFPAGKTRLTSLPDLFFTQLLVEIRDIDELKLLSLLFYYLNRQQGYPRYMTLAELEGEGTVLSALKHADDDPQEVLVSRLQAAIERCIAHRTLLAVRVTDEAGETLYLLANTAQGREAVRQVTAGELVLERRGAVSEPHIDAPRPNIYELYEQNIGLLQPLLAEHCSRPSVTIRQRGSRTPFALPWRTTPATGAMSMPSCAVGPRRVETMMQSPTATRRRRASAPRHRTDGESEAP